MAVPPLDPPPGSLPGDPAKPALREALRARRAAHVESLGEAGARRGAEAVAALIFPHIPADAIVAVYLAFHEELDPAALVDLLNARGQTLALPMLADRTTMYFRAWAPGDPLERGPFRLRQPLAHAAARAPDVIVTPVLGFDRLGGRIGQGASHFDRAFTRYPGARRLGLAWSVQEQPGALPRDPWDIPLHAVATEQEWIVMPECAS